MAIILSDIHTLDQHLSTYLNTPQVYCPDNCPHCSSCNLWLHGVYYRKAACENGDVGPIPIQRFICVPCKHTCSVLPEYIPPKRWFHWVLQEMALALLLMGTSLLGAWLALFDRQPRGPSLSTLHRWSAWLRRHYSLHRLHLCSQFPELGRSANFTEFWQVCLQKMSLSSAMNILHRAGVVIP